MEVGQEKSGMQTLNQSLVNLVLRKKITEKDAYLASADPDNLDPLVMAIILRKPLDREYSRISI